METSVRMTTGIPVKNAGFLTDRLQAYGLERVNHYDGNGMACVLQGLDVSLSRDQERLISLLSTGLHGLRVCLVVYFPLNNDTPEARFVRRELGYLGVDQCIEAWADEE